MKITFVGTSHGVPDASRYCSCTMVEVNGIVYFVDAGAPLVEEIIKRNLDLKNIRAVFTTHSHSDHTGSLFHLASLINWWYFEDRMKFYVTVPEIKDLLKDYMRILDLKEMDEERVQVEIAQPGQVYSDENITVTYIPNMHLKGKFPSYSILIEAEGKKVLFTGDLSDQLSEHDFPQIALEETTDVIISEFAHFRYIQMEPYLEKCKTKQMWLNHIYPLSRIEKYGFMKSKFSFPIFYAQDNDIIEL